MFPDVNLVRSLHDYELELTFSDGVIGRIDFSHWIVGWGGVFTPLENKDFLRASQRQYRYRDHRLAQRRGF